MVACGQLCGAVVVCRNVRHAGEACGPRFVDTSGTWRSRSCVYKRISLARLHAVNMRTHTACAVAGKHLLIC